jgi:hypothetical protein
MSEYERDAMVDQFLNYLTTDLLPRASAEWRGLIGDGEIVSSEVELHVPTARATTAALELYQFDRETRRTIELIYPERRERLRQKSGKRSLAVAAPPTSVRESGFEIQHTEKGSADIFLQAYGVLQGLLLSDPLQFALTLRELLGIVGRVVVHVRRHSPPALLPEEHDLTEMFHIKSADGNLFTGRLGPDTRIIMRHRTADGDEFETVIESRP